MRRIVLCIWVWLGMSLSLVASSHAMEKTHVFQQGSVGYAGLRDTWISTNDSASQDTSNYGQNDVLLLERNGRNNPLLRFDLSNIPANSKVLSAVLSLYNRTQSGLDGQDYARRVSLYRVLVGWDEGNQVASPINVFGAHGATGHYAFQYYPGQGTNVLWGELGMAAGQDYAENYDTYADVVNEGWYTWDVAELARSWIRGEQPNFGWVLRDATGYQDGSCDSREFASSQGTNAVLRPKLTIVYNPDVPFADAGPDQENLQWDRGAVALNGSGSHDCPDGDDATLTYAWRIVQAAYGSGMSGPLPGTTAETNFTPDKAGEWEIELTVTNALGETATDTVLLRLLSIRSGHPRIYLTPAKLAALKARALDSNPRWTQLTGQAEQPDGEGVMHAKALVWQIKGNTGYCNQAVALALAEITSAGESTTAGDVALVFDWCYDCMTVQQRDQFIGYFNAWGDDIPKGESDVPGWGNYWPRYGYSYALIGLASYGDNPRAQEWLDEYRQRRYRDNDLSLLNHIAGGGAWPEGMVYDWIANWPRVKAIEAWRTAAGEDLFESTGWFRDRLGYLLLHHWPGQAEQYDEYYRPYLSTGDGERNRASMANYGRIMALILVGRYSGDPLAAQLQAYLAAPPANRSMDFVCQEEFLWFDPNLGSSTPQLLTHYAPGTGTLFMRSDWPDGAADTLLRPTYATFQCGDHFTYHQHYDQNSFTLFKYGDLALDSGVYSGNGLSHHDVNYYVRTIAHNTLVIYNPQEDFSHSRPEASSNDGGQRSMYQASRSPTTIDYFQQHITQYDTGDILRFQDGVYFTYARGDATDAYNNPTYNQAMDTGLDGNVAKVSRFQREFVYLRPKTPGAPDFVVVFDRVGVTQTAFSGANTKLLFHTLNEPAVNGTAAVISQGETLYTGADLATAVSGGGKLFMKFLLPTQKHLRKVGGRDIKAFWVFEANYDWHWDPSESQPRPTNNFEDVPYGEWRLELEPADTALEHNFLTVLYPAQAGSATMPLTSLVASSGMAGAHISDPSLNRVVLFSSANDGRPPAGNIVYGYQQNGQTLNILFDLTPGTRYTLTSQLVGGQNSVTLIPENNGSHVASSQGVLVFMDSLSVFYVDPAGLCNSFTPCYTSIQEAINRAETGAVIRVAQGTYPESIILNASKSLTLQGGWNSLFTSQTPNTTFIKAPSVPTGSLTMQMLTIRP